MTERNDTTMTPRPRILFIARAYPPTVGGMENLAHQLCEHMRAHADVTSIINHRGKRALPLFLPYAAAKAIRLVRAGQIDAVHLADALLAPVGAAITAATGVTVTASVCGLDVTYPNRAYQALVPRALRRLDMTMPISAATASAMRARTGETIRSGVIPLGVNPLPSPDAPALAEYKRLVGAAEGQRVIVTVGRLIERKGVAWFAREVLPLLPDDVIYAVIGSGPQRAAIEAAADAGGVRARVRMLGRVSDELLAAAYASSDLFAMPNVPVVGDIEGFGLVALEASACGLPVVASNLEGITEAVREGRNGLLVTPLDPSAFAARVMEIIDTPPDARRALGVTWARYTVEHYGWDRTARRYVEAIGACIDRSRETVRLPAKHAA